MSPCETERKESEIVEGQRSSKRKRFDAFEKGTTNLEQSREGSIPERFRETRSKSFPRSEDAAKRKKRVESSQRVVLLSL